MSEQVRVEGIVNNIIFHNKDNGFTVFSIELGDKSAEELICVGNLSGVAIGEHVNITGSYVVHPTYGSQLAAEHVVKSLPTTEIGIERYLGSGVVKGIRARLAKKIVNEFGKETLSIIEEYPERLVEIKGITREKAMAISAIFHEQAELRRVIMYLQGLGISYTYAMKMHKRYREATIDVIRQNPYSLSDDIIGIGFKIADEIAFKIGIEKDSPYRIKCAIKYLLGQATSNGHVYLPKSLLISNAEELLEIPQESIEHVFMQMQMDRSIIQEKLDDEIIVYLNYYYHAEQYIAIKLLELSQTVINKSKNVSGQLELIEQSTAVYLAEQQKQAVKEAMAHGVLVITGGPGTGKTTTIKTIISILEQDSYSIELAAPTGRAAKRMSEATGKEAKTIHRLLEIAFNEEENQRHTYGKNEDNPLETQVIIVDESSMIDVSLMYALLKAVAPGSRLVLVGDVDQLPSVGPGNILKDIIASECIPVVRLNEVFRQAQESAIVMNAHRINRGEMPILNDKSKDFFFVRRSTSDQIIDTILNLITTRLPAYVKSNSLNDIQILTPMRKSPVGLINLNNVLQLALNPPGLGKNEKEVRNLVFREGDKVMQIKNNYNVSWRLMENGRQIGEGLGIFNGDMGIILSINEQEEELQVLFDDNRLVNYEFSRLDELELAYAITIHKSQGSEYRVVVMPIYNGPPMLMSRNLLYTGVTRAKELAVIVGIPDTMSKMIENNREVNRYTSLKDKLKKIKYGMGEFRI